MNPAFERAVPVRWRDTDALGHVNHAVFLTYLEEGRDGFFWEVLGASTMYVVARIELDYRAEVRLEAKHVTVRIGVERVGTTSLTTSEQLLLPNGDVAGEAKVVIVNWDEAQHATLPFTDDERLRLEGFIR